MLFINHDTACRVERTTAPGINKEQYTFTGVEFCQLRVVLLNQRFGIFTERNRSSRRFPARLTAFLLF